MAPIEMRTSILGIPIRREVIGDKEVVSSERSSLGVHEVEVDGRFNQITVWNRYSSGAGQGRPIHEDRFKLKSRIPAVSRVLVKKDKT